MPAPSRNTILALLKWQYTAGCRYESIDLRSKDTLFGLWGAQLPMMAAEYGRVRAFLETLETCGTT
jgi:hypothetical protein